MDQFASDHQCHNQCDRPSTSLDREGRAVTGEKTQFVSDGTSTEGIGFVQITTLTGTRNHKVKERATVASWPKIFENVKKN